MGKAKYDPRTKSSLENKPKDPGAPRKWTTFLFLASQWGMFHGFLKASFSRHSILPLTLVLAALRGELTYARDKCVHGGAAHANVVSPMFVGFHGDRV